MDKKDRLRTLMISDESMAASETKKSGGNSSLFSVFGKKIQKNNKQEESKMPDFHQDGPESDT